MDQGYDNRILQLLDSELKPYIIDHGEHPAGFADFLRLEFPNAWGLNIIEYKDIFIGQGLSSKCLEIGFYKDNRFCSELGQIQNLSVEQIIEFSQFIIDNLSSEDDVDNALIKIRSTIVEFQDYMNEMVNV